jgi:hypothetical protein
MGSLSIFEALQSTLEVLLFLYYPSILALSQYPCLQHPCIVHASLNADKHKFPTVSVSTITT